MTSTRAAGPTLSELRAEVRARIGSASGSGQRDAIVDSLLREAQEEMYTLGDWKHLRAAEELPLIAGVAEYDFPQDANLEKFYTVHVQQNGIWSAPLIEGIPPEYRSYPAGPWPTRFDIITEASNVPGGLIVLMEMFPTPVQDSMMRIEYQRALAPFSVDTDRLTVPKGPVLRMAIARAKAHYRQPDAAQLMQDLDVWLTTLKAQHRRQKVVAPRSSRSTADRLDDVYRLPPR